LQGGKEATREGVFLPANNMIKVIDVSITRNTMSSKSYLTITKNITIDNGYTAIGVISPNTNNNVIAVCGAYGEYNSDGTYKVTMKLVVNYAQQSSGTCNCKVLCIYTGD